MVGGHHEEMTIVSIGGGWLQLEYLYSYRVNNSGPPILIWLLDKNQEEKYFVKTWTALLAEIYHKGSRQVYLGKQD